MQGGVGRLIAPPRRETASVTDGVFSAVELRRP